MALLSKEKKESIANDNISLVYYVVKSFQNCVIPYDELVSIAMVGYAKALDAFNEDRNVKFSTFAINCIKNEILFFLRKEKKHINNNVSMNLILSIDKNGNNLSLEETIANMNNGELSLEEKVCFKEDMADIMEVIDELSEKEKYIIIYRFGLDRGIIKTQNEIAKHIGMSQANISKLEKSIIVKCKKMLNDKKLASGPKAIRCS